MDYDVSFILRRALTPVIPDTSSRLRLATTFLRDTYAVIHLGFKGTYLDAYVSNALQSAILLVLCS